jgi:hypothetical protein
MRRPVCPEGQADLWPNDVMAAHFAHRRILPPDLSLPFPVKSQISTEQVMSVLAVSKDTVRRLRKLHYLEYYDLPGSALPSRILYDSFVSYCNLLHEQAGVPPCRTASPGLRLRAVDLLPFPLENNLTAAFVADLLDISRRSLVPILEAGLISCYRLFPRSIDSPWRIDSRSVERYLQGVRNQVHIHPTGRAALRR